jgi:hypothetical protein
MSDPKPSKKAQQPPDGQIRVSQLVTTFGPGAMIDLLDHAVLVGGTDYWRYDKGLPTPALDEPRLREAVLPRVRALGLTLSHSAPFRTGPAGNDDSRGPWNGIQVAEFPAWFVCQDCRALAHRKSLEEKGGEYRHACSRNKVGKKCVPVRFVATCKDGHLEEFPWNWFVHHDGERCDGKDLKLFEGPTGDFAEIRVHCEACKRTRPLSEAREDQMLPECHGRRPWLGLQADVGCKHKLHLLSRTASNAYFAQTVSALTIPEKGRELQQAVSSAKLWPTLKRADTADRVATLRAMIDDVDVTIASITGKSATDYTNDEIADAVRAVHGGADAPREGLRTAEYKQFLTAKNERPGEIPPRHDDFFASRLVPTTKLPKPVADITLVKKLRRVTAQVGFTRLSAPTPDLQGNYDDAAKLSSLTLAETWLPATEVFGEGVLVRFDEDRVRAWEERPVVLDRGKRLLAGFTKRFSKEDATKFPGVRYFMLHSLSHLLMNAMSLECGYSASSLGERLYCAPATDPTPMAAILILTGSSGAEGTLGGLVEQGRRIQHHLNRAIELGRLCSNDPICAHHVPDENDPTERYLEGAACHGCLYVAEPSCERFNSYLDRALVIPTLGNDPGLAFFGEKA